MNEYNTSNYHSKELDKELISSYFEIKSLLKKSPTQEDVDNFGRYKSDDYIQRWGSWYIFLENIGEPISVSDDLKQDLIKEYYEERDLFGSEPSSEQIDEYGTYKIEDYKKVFGSWLQFLMYIEELDKLQGKYDKGKIPKDALLVSYYDLKKKLGHIPNVHEINTNGKYGVDYYTIHFGSYDKFLFFVNEKTTLATSEENLIQNYYDVKNKIGKQPTSMDLQSYGKYSYQVYLKRFGSYNNFLIKIREPLNRGYSQIAKEDLFQEYIRIKDSIGKEPTIEDINKYSKYNFLIYQKRFGTWMYFKDELNEFTLNFKS